MACRTVAALAQAELRRQMRASLRDDLRRRGVYLVLAHPVAAPRRALEGPCYSNAVWLTAATGTIIAVLINMMRQQKR